MTKPNALPPRRRQMPIDRVAGVAMQFERTDGGYFFRRHGHGAAIRVSAAERDAFAATALRTLLIHAVALALCGAAGWMIVLRAMDGANVYVRAVSIGVVLSLIALALWGSLRWNADAPGRALAGRPTERPARDPDFLEHESYGTILGATIFLVFLMALGTKQPGWIYVTFATVVVIGGAVAALRKWWFDRALTPDQTARAAQARQAEAARARDRQATRDRHSTLGAGGALLVLFFVVLQLVVMAGGLFAGIGATLGIAGTSMEQSSGGVVILALLMGVVLAGLLAWGVEVLCKRLTGESAADTLSSIPPGW